MFYRFRAITLQEQNGCYLILVFVIKALFVWGFRSIHLCRYIKFVLFAIIRRII